MYYLMYKSIDRRTPQFLQEMFTFKENAYYLKDSNNKVIVPQALIEYLKRSFSYSGALLWNCLPVFFRSMASLSSFQKGLDAFCFDINNLYIWLPYSNQVQQSLHFQIFFVI